MHTVDATTLKNRLGEVLERLALGPVAVRRHGKVVAYLVAPSGAPATPATPRSPHPPPRWGRREEERVLRLCERGDFRPSRWARAGDRWLLAGVAALLASDPRFDRPRMLTLAERLHAGMSATQAFGQWLARAPVDPARFLPMVRAQREHEGPTA